MSHLKERKEKICLNCKTELHGRYCHLCGQENLEPKETVWHLVQHFFNDVTHFDGKFFSTVKLLLRRPGFLSAEYVAGRRMSYLNPIRMYVFTSAIFFIILFTITPPEEMMREKVGKSKSKGLAELVAEKTKYEKELAATKNGDEKDDYGESINHLSMEIGMIKKMYGDTTTRKFSEKDLSELRVEAIGDSLQETSLSPETKKRLRAAMSVANDPVASENIFDMGKGSYSSVEQYDSAERALPDSLRDGWLRRAVMRKKIQMDMDYHADKQRFKERFMENLMHSLPKILFWSLPFFALILNILYFRHKKQFYYVDHGIFSIHVYCATFLLLLISMLLNQLSNWLGWGWFNVLSAIVQVGVYLYLLIYLYKAMRGFYKQGRGKTFVKYFIACSLAFVINLILLLIFVLLSAANIGLGIASE